MKILGKISDFLEQLEYLTKFDKIVVKYQKNIEENFVLSVKSMIQPLELSVTDQKNVAGR